MSFVLCLFVTLLQIHTCITQNQQCATETCANGGVEGVEKSEAQTDGVNPNFAGFRLEITDENRAWLPDCITELNSLDENFHTQAVKQFWDDGGPLALFSHIDFFIPPFSEVVRARAENETQVGDSHVREQDDSHTRPHDTQPCVVLDVGGFHGQFVDWMWNRYRCNHIYTFEPFPEFISHLENRFAHVREHVHVLPYALAHETGISKIYKRGDATTMSVDYLNKIGGHPEAEIEIRAKRFHEFVNESYHSSTELIDLLEINCEGCEYELLGHLIVNNFHLIAKVILIQFHISRSANLIERCQLHHHLKNTHTKVMDYPFTWEMWVRNDELQVE
eukprot:GDKI01000341.1.p1 GENE.GDKI01000341.1~~GDKI01000341.1.p1  ORF type:complete len:334 (-),score=32.39 GDKI01000341.1:97-1098(-)